jgi:hypothetical protein
MRVREREDKTTQDIARQDKTKYEEDKGATPPTQRGIAAVRIKKVEKRQLKIWLSKCIVFLWLSTRISDIASEFNSRFAATAKPNVYIFQFYSHLFLGTEVTSIPRSP